MSIFNSSFIQTKPKCLRAGLTPDITFNKKKKKERNPLHFHINVRNQVFWHISSKDLKYLKSLFQSFIKRKLENSTTNQFLLSDLQRPMYKAAKSANLYF